MRHGVFECSGFASFTLGAVKSLDAPWPSLDKRIHNAGGLIAGAVVDHHHLDAFLRVVRCEQGVQIAGDDFLFVVGCHEDRHHWPGGLIDAGIGVTVGAKHPIEGIDALPRAVDHHDHHHKGQRGRQQHNAWALRPFVLPCLGLCKCL